MKRKVLKLTHRDLAQALIEPAIDANKYSRGRLLVVAGSTQYPGAAILTVLGAARCGAGYVTLATPAPVAHIAQSHLLTVQVVSLKADKPGGIAAEAINKVFELVEHADALVIGPGLSRSTQTTGVVRDLIAHTKVPTVIDADGLNAFTQRTEELERCAAPLILTPHEGELERLASVEELAQGQNIVVAKGPDTAVVDKTRFHLDDTGPASLATAGTGDVLSGIIGSLLCQGVDPYLAAAAGVRLHSLAAQSATAELTCHSMIATDVIEHLPVAMSRMKENV